MDPHLTAASVLTVLGAAGGTCKVLYNLILDLKDAPSDIRRQNKKLQHLHENISCLLQVCNELPTDLQLVTHLNGVHEFFQDMRSISLDLEHKKIGLNHGRAGRVKEICKWLLFDRQLKKFFQNLEHYNIIFSHALWAAQL